MEHMDGAAPVIPPTALPLSAGQDGQAALVSPATNPEFGPPRKRQRTGEQMASTPDLASGSTPAVADEHQDDMDSIAMPAAPVRDERFYIDGADCVLMVEDTLFRVHRFLLARDSSAFQYMFSLPASEATDGAAEEGFCDEKPIQLFGESADNFRVLLSVLYALPAELHAYNSGSADIPRLRTIATLTNKYHFLSTTSWAVSALHSVTSGEYGPPTHPDGDLTRAPAAALARTLEVAMQCGHTRLVDYVVDSWSNRILSRKLSPRMAMHVADRWGLDALKGVAYYVQLMEMDQDCESLLGSSSSSSVTQTQPNAITLVALDGDTGAQDPEEAAVVPASLEPHADEGEDAPITPSQNRRLHAGFFSLVRLWRALSLSQPTFPRPDGCTYHLRGCVATFRTIWCEAARSEKAARYGSADVVGRLRCVEEQLRASADLACALSPGCKREALAAVKRLMKEVQESLAGRFVDLP